MTKTEAAIEVAWGLVITFGGISSVAHAIAALAFGATLKRGAFERLAIALLMLVGWPLFSVGMMLRGYDEFWKKTWGKG